MLRKLANAPKEIDSTSRLPERKLHTMRINRNLIQKARWAIAVALMLWCAGAGCALGTYAHAAMRNNDLPQAKTGGMALTGISAAAGAHSCCKARHSSEHVGSASSLRPEPRAAGFEEVALPESSSSSNASSCCPLTSGTFVVTARQSVTNDRAAEAIKSDAQALLLADAYATPRALPLRLPNQNQTYLRGCAFLI
jgi:hypothetical protein